MYLNTGIFKKTKQTLPDNESSTLEPTEATTMSRSGPASKLTAFLGDVFNMRENKKLDQAGKPEGCESKAVPGSKEDVEQGSGRATISDWSVFEGVFHQELSKGQGKELLPHFLSCVAELLTSYVQSESDRSAKVLDFHHPHQVREQGALPVYRNELCQSKCIVAKVSQFTYEAAPVFTLMEEVVLSRMRQLIGWQEGEAMFAPGGAISNLYGVLLARHRYSPEVKTKGLRGSRLVVMTSEQSHFSITRAAAILGIGTDHVIYIKCHDNGKMDMNHLQDQIAAVRHSGGDVIMVNATCGTTVLGAYDPVEEMAEICGQFGIWLHCDCAWGGGALLSRDYRHLVAGIHRADSVTWNPHKMMGVPLQCSAFLTRHKGVLKSCNSLNAAYLYQKDKHYDVTFDTGDLSIQCGRHNDIFKLWLMWRSKGDQGFEEQMNKNFELAVYLRDKVKERPGFHLVLEEVLTFTYTYIESVAPTLKARMMECGSLMVQYQPLGKLPNLFRVAVSNPALTRQDLDFLLEEMDNLGRDIPTPADW
ncbi:glutamate decarboxylase 1 [Elysia marginata]|uniref:Glutamate decarboxylase 1 n=1 Tax=Elysia marginata TaxID=1093978 RepID=A0AAV4GGV8_9GAST|nr:glutamate decarboxylase 1 [Elysia marginata]